MKASTSVQADLHTHSTASDGTRTPAELVREASERGISILALTDHDTTAGLPDARSAAAEYAITLIPGIELTTDVERGELHMLGYFVDPGDGYLQSVLTKLRDSRLHRAERILDRLDEIGIRLSRDTVIGRAATESIGRPHIAQALIETGVVSSVDQAFHEYLGKGAPAYVPRESLDPSEAVRLIRRAGGLAVFAHPLSCREYRRWIPELMAAGLAGMEVYYGEYSPEQRDALAEIADQHDLLKTGGSDYHGPNFKEGRDLGTVPVPQAVVERLLAAGGWQ